MKRILVTGFVLLQGLIFCFSSAWAAAKMPVYVSILPQKFFVESIAKDLVEISVMVAPGANPHDYEPTPAQMKTLSSARIYFAIGDPFEDTWLKKITASNSTLKIIHTEDGIEKKPITRHEILLHGDEAHHDHAEGVQDPHIWLSPPLVMLQARNILAGLIQEMPEQQAILEENYKQFIGRLADLDAELLTLFKGDANKRFLVFHPAWGYFADAYGLKQTSIEIEGKEPKAKDLAQLIQFSQKNGIKEIFIQPQFSTRQAEVIAKEINARLVPADDLAENWLDNIRSVATSLKQALR